MHLLCSICLRSLCSFSAAMVVNFMGSQAHSFVFPSSSKLKIFFWKELWQKQFELVISWKRSQFQITFMAGHCYLQQADVMVIFSVLVFWESLTWQCSGDITNGTIILRFQVVEQRAACGNPGQTEPLLARSVAIPLLWLLFCVVYNCG